MNHAESALAAATAIVEAFAAHDVERYFACFDEDASFVFHNVAETLTAREQYRQLWKEWEAEGFHVDGCRSLEAQVQLATPDLAIFTHRVRTRLAGVDGELRERETIVLQRQDDGSWLGVHEHLSPDPLPAGEEDRT